VYVVYSDDHNLYYSFSKTFGQTWSGPYPINKSPSNTAIFPWSSAGAAGGLDVIWYGTDYYSAVHPDNYPPEAARKVYFSQNLQAATPNSPWTQVAASGVIHYGGVCESGVTCTGNRDPLDDFGVAVSPTTGLAAIIYTNDQFINSTAEPATRRDSGSYVCTAALTNSVDCSHTDIAIQTGGSTLNQRKHHFEIDEEDFEETDLHSDGGHAPEFSMHGTNTGNSPITSITAQISGLPLTVSWNKAFPLQPGQDATATTTTLPLGLLITVGGIYTITVTVTMADGTKETQTTSAIYTLGAGLGL